MSLTTGDAAYEISTVDWEDRAVVNLWRVRDKGLPTEQSALMAKASVYYPKDPDYGWALELSVGGERFNRGMASERVYYDGSLVSAKLSANEFISIYKKGLEGSND